MAQLYAFGSFLARALNNCLSAMGGHEFISAVHSFQGNDLLLAEAPVKPYLNAT